MQALLSAATGVATDKLKAGLTGLLAGFVSLLSCGWVVSYSVNHRRPAAALMLALGQILKGEPSWLSDAVRWLHSPGHHEALLVVALASGLAASGSARTSGPLRNGLSAFLAWVLFLTAVEGLGAGTAVQEGLKSAGLFVVVAGGLALVSKIQGVTFPRSGALPSGWSGESFWRGVELNLVYLGLVPLLFPMVLIGWALGAYGDNS